ncbi:hypothetical protein HBH70_231450 [Parastagonospora nodorum]|nr:hypothetical protein HBH51_227730 [Parastagonospora nodorum]KAH4012158.1 hypothetical protein HBI09_224830 [Parastagonospora nodorum]KAH4056721.1 hypothetical protein HBH50_239430 [Parastagonospora nodorum]KAH4077766.1 hypothetical protein HBH48_237090 [Parastagonospora nodorum]KAH4215835.1 hypothetical protein HBI06_240250 [Parastagonospora nodorum]
MNYSLVGTINESWYSISCHATDGMFTLSPVADVTMPVWNMSLLNKKTIWKDEARFWRNTASVWQVVAKILDDQRPQAPTVNSFYGPGSWAAWCIVLITSWLPIIQDDHSHNLHFISCALYTNWAAVDAFRQLSLNRRVSIELTRMNAVYDTLSSTTFFKETEVAIGSMTVGQKKYGVLDAPEAMLPQELRGAGPVTSWRSKLEKVKLVQSALMQIRDASQAMLLISTATRAVISIGAINALLQLLVCWWKTMVYNEREGLNRRRSLIILLGLLLPSVAYTSEIIVDAFCMNELRLRSVAEICVFILTSVIVAIFWHCSSMRLLPWQSTQSSLAFALARAFMFYSVVGYAGGTVGRMGLKALPIKCYLIPCTPVQIGDMDQAFALFVALCFLVYEYGARLWKYAASISSRNTTSPATTRMWYGARRTSAIA